jgi:hypothetical protein
VVHLKWRTACAWQCTRVLAVRALHGWMCACEPGWPQQRNGPPPPSPAARDCMVSSPPQKEGPSVGASDTDSCSSEACRRAWKPRSKSASLTGRPDGDDAVIPRRRRSSLGKGLSVAEGQAAAKEALAHQDHERSAGSPSGSEGSGGPPAVDTDPVSANDPMSVYGRHWRGVLAAAPCCTENWP